jgi:peptidoglycan/xylan/chitin deacetylase (PgdA/CDA1 family)
MKAVMYHYVREDASEAPWYYYLDFENFKAQLDHFEDAYGFVGREGFLKAANGGKVPDGIVLTFDDGLRDHYDWVFPELRKRGLWGIFYIPTGPYEHRSALHVHRIHALIGKYGGHTILNSLEDIVDINMVPDARREEFRTETYQRQNNTKDVRRVKRILNYFISYEFRPSVLNILCGKFPDADLNPQTFYLRPQEIKKIHRAGNIIGSHSVSHRVFSKLSNEEQRHEIEYSFKHLEELVDSLGMRTFCYPYGGFHTFTDYTQEILKNVDCLFSFNVESRDILPKDFDIQPHALPRYDCNEFRHGEAQGLVD